MAWAEALKAEIGDAWIPQQFENPANPAIHEQTTAQKILADFPEGLRRTSCREVKMVPHECFCVVM